MDKRGTSKFETYLDRNTVVGNFWERDQKNSARCYACGHRCLIHENKRGICQVRINRNGEIRVPWGYVTGLSFDPIEKKPFYHVLPGSRTLSFGMLGCNLHCQFCQNWVSSQTLREDQAGVGAELISADEIVEMACQHQVKVLTSTYNEPLITAEWAVEVFKKGKEMGFATSFVSNGYATDEVLMALRPHLDFLKIDLKCFSDRSYRKLGAVLNTVLKSIKKAHELGYWLEIVTLLVPGFNDDPEELRELVAFIGNVSRDIPWHVTAFHPDFKMMQNHNTPVQSLLRAGEIGKKEGLHFVYVGNLPGQVGDWESTFCQGCGQCLVKRRGFRVIENLMSGALCPGCGVKVPGRWTLV